MEIPFVGSAYRSRSLNVNAQRCVNLYPEIDETGKKVLVLYGTPGLTTQFQINTFPSRGMLQAGENLYIVVKDKLYSVSKIWVITELGTIDTSAGRVSMAYSGTQLMLVDGTNGYVYTEETGVFAQITDGDFPGANVVQFIDGFFIFNVPDSNQFMLTNIYDGLTIDALDIASAEGSPDKIMTLVANHRELWVLGEYTTEVFYNAGTPFPFQRIGGAFIERGIAARWSAAKLDNSLFWLSRDEKGQGVIVKAEGYQTRVISTRAIEYEISQYETIADTYAYSYTEAGRGFYVEYSVSTLGHHHSYQTTLLGRLLCQYQHQHLTHRGYLLL